MDGFVEVKCRWVVKLGERIGELVKLDFGFEEFDQYMWVVPPFGKVSAWQKRPSNFWLVVVDFLLEMA